MKKTKLSALVLCLLLTAAQLLSGCNDAVQLTIESSADGASFTAGEAVVFSGSAANNKDAEGPLLVWSSGRDGELGTGNSFTKSDLSEGAHTITLTAEGTSNRQGSASVLIFIESSAASTTTTASGATTTAPAATGLFPGTVILGRPTETSITASWYCLQAGAPLELTLDSLSANAQYYYRVYFREARMRTAPGVLTQSAPAERCLSIS